MIYKVMKGHSIRVLDFKKVKHQEREAAKALFKTKEGKTQLKDIQRKAKTNPAGLTPEQVRICF